MHVFEATQFVNVAAGTRYNYEKNHAWFPLHPYLMSRAAEFTGFSVDVAGFLMQLLFSYLNTILLYKVGMKVTKSAVTAEASAYLYLISHSMLYQVALYSENLFLLLTLLGMHAMYKIKEQPSFYCASSHRVVIGTFIFSLAALTRSSGVFLGIFTAFFMGNKLLRRASNCITTLKIMLYCYVGLLSMLLALGVVIYWKPYVLHCDTKLDRTD